MPLPSVNVTERALITIYLRHWILNTVLPQNYLSHIHFYSIFRTSGFFARPNMSVCFVFGCQHKSIRDKCHLFRVPANKRAKWAQFARYFWLTFFTDVVTHMTVMSTPGQGTERFGWCYFPYVETEK